ncbi:MAG: VOC family protein [Pseudooceanicola sp.]
MAVLRIVPNLQTADPQALADFYRRVFGVGVAMDMDFIVTLTGTAPTQTPQLSTMREGGSGTPVPLISVEVDDLDATLDRARAAQAPVEYGPVQEPWGVRRFYLRDPEGTLVNVLEHREEGEPT